MTPASEGEYRVKVAGPGDLGAVMAIAVASAEAPRWPAAAWEIFAEPQPGPLQAVLLLAQTGEGEICGWLAATLLLAETAELEFVMVQPAHRGRGLGRSLVTRWLAWARVQGATEAFLEVRASNQAALALYRGLGFVDGSRRRGYYTQPVEDALTMRKGL